MEEISLPVKYTELTPRQKIQVREQYIRLQGGNCHFCKASLSGPAAETILKMKVSARLFPIGFFKYPVHLHHSHDTGLTIGAVHNHCNAVLWQYFEE
jgi:hypothetical protein